MRILFVCQTVTACGDRQAKPVFPAAFACRAKEENAQ